MTDRDGDSRMQNLDESGSERSSRSSSIFPHEAVSTPPPSQPGTVMAMDREDALMGEASDQAQQLSSGIDDTTPSTANTGKPTLAGNIVETDENAPGWAWRHRRAIEEFDKCSEAVLDKHFSLLEFGDIVLEQLKEQEADYDPYALIGSLGEAR